MTHIRNGIPVTHRPDLSSMPQNECWFGKYITLCEPEIFIKSTGILAEMAELTSNSD